MAQQNVDVCVVGAGVAGLACAQGLARQGCTVLLLDRLQPLPACLKAEKMDAAGVQALQRLGFAPGVQATMTPLRTVDVFFGERYLGCLRPDPPEAGFLYHTLVNTLRAGIDPRITFHGGSKVRSLEPGPDGVAVVTDAGTRVGCRLVVLATGEAPPVGGAETAPAPPEPEPPHQAFVAAFTLAGAPGAPGRPVDSQTYHRPIAGAPVAYATFFRVGAATRVNIFCPGPVTAAWQRDLKERPLAVLAAGNRALAAATESAPLVSPVLTRKVSVVRKRAVPQPGVVRLGDAAHTIDPSGGGGAVFALLEAELLLDHYAPRWFGAGDFSAAAIGAFYSDPRRTAADRHYFAAGRYVFALNHDRSATGRWRRLHFMLRQGLAARRAGRRPAGRPPGDPWPLPAAPSPPPQ